MATILYDKAGKSVKIQDATKVGNLLKDGFTVEPVAQKEKAAEPDFLAEPVKKSKKK